MCYEHALESQTLKAKGEILKRRAAKLCPKLDAHFWIMVRWHQQTIGKEWDGLLQGPRPMWISWVTGRATYEHFRPAREVEPDVLRGFLRRVGLEKHTDAFVADGYTNLEFIYSLSPEDQREVLTRDLPLTDQQASALLSALDAYIVHPPTIDDTPDLSDAPLVTDVDQLSAKFVA